MKIKIPKTKQTRDFASANLVPNKFSPYLFDMNYICSKVNSGILHGREREVNRIYNSLLKSRNANVVLLGGHGVGKSATLQIAIENVLKKKCPKELKNCHFLYLNIEAIIPELMHITMRRKFENIIKFISSSNNFIVVIDQVHLVQTNIVLSYYFTALVREIDVKVIGMSTEEEYYSYFEFDSKLRSNIDIIPILEPQNKKIYPMIKDVVKKFEEIYNVEITEDIVNYIISVLSVFKNEMYNPGLAMNLIEKSMIVAKRRKEKVVSRKAVNYNLNLNYEFYRQMSKEDKEVTAYHEAGHFIVLKLSENIKNCKTTSITIVPAEDFLGQTTLCFEDEKQTSMDLDYFIDYMAVDLAGIVAEKIYYGADDKYTSGGSSDLKHVTETARNVIASCGMVKGRGENMSYLGNLDIENLVMLSDEIKNEIDLSTKELIRRAEERARNILNNNRALLDRIAKELIKNDILDERDLDRICAEVQSEEAMKAD